MSYWIVGGFVVVTAVSLTLGAFLGYYVFEPLARTERDRQGCACHCHNRGLGRDDIEDCHYVTQRREEHTSE